MKTRICSDCLYYKSMPSNGVRKTRCVCELEHRVPERIESCPIGITMDDINKMEEYERNYERIYYGTATIQTASITI